MDVEDVSGSVSDTKGNLRSKQNGNKSYKKISNSARQRLIELVYLKNYLLKDAAKMLNINYSTAKTILRIFRIEKRVEKKNADEERELNKFLCKYKSDKSKGSNSRNTMPSLEERELEIDSMQNKQIDFFAKKVEEFQVQLDNCYKEIKQNQEILHKLLNISQLCNYVSKFTQ